MSEVKELGKTERGGKNGIEVRGRQRSKKEKMMQKDVEKKEGLKKE